MGLSNLANWNETMDENNLKSSNSTGCGTADEEETTNSACGTSCGATDETEK